MLKDEIINDMQLNDLTESMQEFAKSINAQLKNEEQTLKVMKAVLKEYAGTTIYIPTIRKLIPTIRRLIKSGKYSNLSLRKLSNKFGYDIRTLNKILK